MSRREEILAAVPSIPALPTAAAKVLQLLQDDNSSMGDIMGAIEYDPGLTSDVLRLANSAFFAGPRKIGSLPEAGVLFGTARIQQLVLASAVFPLASKPLKGYDLPPGELLDNLIGVAVGAEELGRTLSEKPPAHAFTAGLLHGVGKIVLGTFVEVDALPILELAHEEGLPFDEAERRILGIDHAEVGAELLRHWQLPGDIEDAVRWQYRPDNLEGDKLLVDLVHVAVHLSISCGLGIGIDGLNYRPSPSVVERLHLKTKIAEQVTCKMLTELQAIRTQHPVGKEGS